MATHGSIGEFNSSKEGWVSYTEWLEQYFAANEVVSADKQRAILLTCCGPDTYQLIKSLLAPARPTDKSFQELVQLVKDRHEPNICHCSKIQGRRKLELIGRAKPS